MKLILITLVCLSKAPQGRAMSLETIYNKNGFVAFPSPYGHFPEVYKELRTKGEPIYVTVDPILHALHLLYDYSLRTIESEILTEELQSLLLSLRDRFEDLTNVKNREISSCALTNLAYLEAALKLLDPNYIPSQKVKGLVEEELKLIEEHKGLDSSKILPVLEDYSQYKPRGHYTRSEKLSNYFKAMMYLGRIPFYVNPKDKKELDKNIKMTRCAILFAHALLNDSTLLNSFEKIYYITSYFVGKSDDLNFVDLIPLIKEHFPDFPSGFSDDEKIVQFMEAVSKYAKPKIFSTLFRDIDTPEEKLSCVKFMSQRFIPDSYIFQNLVYAKVGTREKPRLFPKSLDVFAVLGNERAYRLLLDYYREDKYKNYKKMLDSLRKEFSALGYSEWHQNAYYHFLYIAKTINENPKFPTGFRINTEAYQDKLLVSQRAFWAELRHDTILYAKQSYTAKVTAFIPESRVKKVVVEPLPKTYREIEVFLDNFEAFLRQIKFENPEIFGKIGNLRALIKDIQNAVDFEIKGKTIPMEIANRLYNYGEILENLYSFSENFTQNSADTLLPLVADVHTDVNTKQVLQVAIGKPLEIWINYNGETFKGAMFSSYEFTWPMKDRLTDEEWQKRENYPPMEDWIQFIVF